MTNSRDKGARGEREWAKYCREQGYTESRRGQQHSGLEGEDVVGLPFVHQEVKRVEKLNLEDALAQSIRDCQGKIPIVAHRRNNTPWKVTMLAEDWFALYREWEASESMKKKVE